MLSKKQLKKMKIVLMGGEGSGNFGHAGRPGKVGGSVGENRDYNSESELLSYPDFPEYENDYIDTSSRLLTIPSINSDMHPGEIEQQIKVFAGNLARKGSASISVPDELTAEFAKDWVSRVWYLDDARIQGGGKFKVTLMVVRGSTKDELPYKMEN